MTPNAYHRLDNGNLHCIGVTQVAIDSFGYGHGKPPEADITLDARRLFRNPHHDPAMVELNGLHAPVRRHVLTTDGVALLVRNAVAMTSALVADVGNPHNRLVRLAVGCTGGRHRSVAIAEAVADMLRVSDVGVNVQHRDIHKPIIQPV